MMIFTTKRLVFVDMQGFMGIGKKVEYFLGPTNSMSPETGTRFPARNLDLSSILEQA